MLPCINRDSIIRIDMPIGGDARWFRLSEHIHSFTTAFDPPENRLGFVLDRNQELNFDVSGVEPFDGFIKLTGIWLATAVAAPFSVAMNGVEIWSGTLHMPKVCAGWPSIYWRVPQGCLKNGCNKLSLRVGETPLNINECSIYLRLRGESSIEPMFVPRVLTTGQHFSITMLIQDSVSGLKVEHDDCIELISSPADGATGEQDFFFRAIKSAEAARVSFVAGDERVDVDLPSILDVPAGLPCHVGTDSDDHRHDDTGLMGEMLRYFFRSGIGDLVMFRPKQNRNCIVSPDADLCRSWLDICRQYNGQYLLCEWGPEGEFPEEVHKEIADDPSFVGYHMHEPYFVMVEPMANEAIRKAGNFKERRDAYMAEMRRYVEHYHSLGGRAACGEASWLATYDGEAGFDILNIEIVTGAGPHLAAARGAMRGRPNMALGHHIAVEWYLGFPYDDLKSHRFWLMMLLTYTHGGQYIYAENSLFFTNSYQRHDPEDDFTTRNRELMRKFFDITKLQPRFGEPCAELAVAYGNLESMLWYHDDLLPEMDDASDWGGMLWNKWKGALHKPCMRALDAWMPPLEIERYHGNRSILKWFSGNPYGNVEMVSAERDADVFSQYKVLAFLGWNTMIPELIEKLKAYVSGGGILFIAGCHFDKRTLPGGEYEIDTSEAEDLLGLSVNGPGPMVDDVQWRGESYPMSGDLRSCSVDLRSANVEASDANGNPILLRNSFGSGEVLFYNFWDHPASPEALSLSKSIMSRLGEDNRSDFGLDDSYGINCSHWYDAETSTHRLYLVNVNWMKPRTSRSCRIRLWGRAFPVVVDEHAPLVVTVKDSVAVIPNSPHVFVRDIVKDEKSCTVRVVGVGSHSVRVITDTEDRTVAVRLSGVRDLVFDL
ncbi:MAG: type 1 glutamine amidotransferase family protein [Armatimonadota bacterium]